MVTRSPVGRPAPAGLVREGILDIRSAELGVLDEPEVGIPEIVEPTFWRGDGGVALPEFVPSGAALYVTDVNRTLRPILVVEGLGVTGPEDFVSHPHVVLPHGETLTLIACGLGDLPPLVCVGVVLMPPDIWCSKREVYEGRI